MLRILPLFLLVLISFIFSSDKRISNHQDVFLSNYVNKIKFVQYNEDFKVKIVDYHEILSVKLINNVFYEPYQRKTGNRVNNDILKDGYWKIVTYNEDYRIKIVDKGEDFSIKYY